VSIRRTLRSTIKWGGAAVTVLLLIVWVGRPGTCGITGKFTMIEVGRRGQLHFLYGDIPSMTQRIGFGYSRCIPWDKLEPVFDVKRYPYSSSEVTEVSVPLWFLALLTATPSFLIWRRDRKPRLGVCPKCGYSRTGLPGDRACPECGAAVPGVTPQASRL
jgi:hypothetical protein